MELVIQLVLMLVLCVFLADLGRAYAEHDARHPAPVGGRVPGRSPPALMASSRSWLRAPFPPAPRWRGEEKGWRS